MKTIEEEEGNTGGNPTLELNASVSGISENLAIDRTRMAAERTLMAWLRTCYR